MNVSRNCQKKETEIFADYISWQKYVTSMNLKVHQ